MTIDGDACEMIAWVSSFLDLPEGAALNFWQTDLFRSLEGRLFVFGEGRPAWIADKAPSSRTSDDGLTVHILDEVTAAKVATAMDTVMGGGTVFLVAKRKDWLPRSSSGGPSDLPDTAESLRLTRSQLFGSSGSSP